MAAWSLQKQMKVAGLLTLSIALFYLAFTIDRVDGKVFEHTNVVQLDATSFDEKVNDGKVHFVKFYAPWCGHCKKLAPVWSELADELKHNKQVSIGQVDCTQAQDLCKKLEVTGYPTLKSFHAGESHAQFRGGRSLEALKEYVERAVQELTAETTA
ncbi:g10376 [Coccomyxa viridis]|uniref:G10376 protein n=1 Tax=Coccomyxa viridis TaxID=1274662 RepID=A0ABP1G5D9_9CHLO